MTFQVAGLGRNLRVRFTTEQGGFPLVRFGVAML